MAKLKKHGKGIVLMHDFQKATAEAAPTARRAQGRRLQDRAHEAEGTMTTIASYDEPILKHVKAADLDGRPTSSVVRTISE